MTDTPTHSMPYSGEPGPLCRICGLECSTNPAKQLGIHISCVQEANQRYKSVRIASPGYGGPRGRA
jgi:hypothetical protein